uniref:EXS domain-containing protein n=1 Tax=Schistosoma curassoni TaxID=6186 RepID=A0A183JKC5_9TREM
LFYGYILVVFYLNVFICVQLFYFVLSSFQGRIIRAPFAKVSFADFWLADQLTSLSFIFPDIAYFICFYSSQIDWANGMSYKPQNSSSLTLPSLVMGHNSQYSNSTRLTIPSCASHSNEIIEKWLKQTIDDYLVKHQENTHFASEKNFT